jgi:hypothetical protein
MRQKRIFLRGTVMEGSPSLGMPKIKKPQLCGWGLIADY